MTQINEEEKAAKVIVPDYQLSLAIGKEGQNARLAAKLTGYKIDIKCQSQIVDNLFGDSPATEPEHEDLYGHAPLGMENYANFADGQGSYGVAELEDDN